MAEKPTYEELEKKIQELKHAESERKRAEDALKESEKRYRKLFDSSKDAIMTIEPPTWKFTSGNHAIIEMFKVRDEKEFTSLGPWDVSPDNQPDGQSSFEKANKMIQRAMEEGSNFFEWTHRRATGENFLATVLLTKVNLEDRAFLQATVKDITGPKQAEKALQKSEELLKEAQRVAHIGHWELDLDIGTPVWSDEIFRIFGLDPDEGEPSFAEYETYIHPEDWPLLDGAVRKAGKDGIPFDLIFRIVRPGEEMGWVHAIGTTLVDSEGNVVKLFGTAQDVTTIQKAEKAFQESQQKFHSMVDNIGIGVALISPKMELLELNRRMREWFPGIDMNHRPICYRAFNNPPRCTVCDYCPTCKTLQDGKVHEATSETPQAGGIRNYRIVSSPIINEQGEVTAAIEMVDDITDRLKLENQLRQSQKLESIGNLAGGIAHDFNNILSVIIGFTELTLEEAEKGSIIEENLQEVYTAGKRAKDLVKHILAFARQAEEEIKPIQVDTIAGEAIKFIRSSIPTSIDIRKKIDSNSLIMGNATQVHQIFMNLFTNAAHAMEDEGGILEVSLKDVIVDHASRMFKTGLEPGDYIEIKVSDTGVGIPPDVIGFIFEPYYTTKPSGEGTGMGLSVVHGIVESYGGKITVDSELGKGTTFSIYLPLTKKRGESLSYESEFLPTGIERILFVDDELLVARIGSQVLERLGYRVTIRTSSVEALELFRSRPDDFHLVITDMTMPNMTGDKLVHELMKVRSDIPVILCTGYSKKISDKTASEIGIKAFAYKPIVMADLAKTVRNVLDENKARLKNKDPVHESRPV